MADDEELSWYHLSVCRGMETKLFYEDYESDPVMAAVMDDICLSCPVRSLCLESGLDNKEYGLWGGVYLTAGTPDRQRNIHKTEDIWDEVWQDVR